MTSLTKNQHVPNQKFFFEYTLEDFRVFWHFDQVCKPYRSGVIPAQSHVCFGVFFANPLFGPDAKVLVIRKSVLSDFYTASSIIPLQWNRDFSWYLRPWRLGGFGDFREKNSSFRLPYQRHSSSANCTRELFNGSNGSASPVDCTRKKNFAWGVRVFCEWRHKWSSFRVILAHVAWPRAQPLGQSVWLKFSLETRLESESFEPLIDFESLSRFWFKSYDLK